MIEPALWTEKTTAKGLEAMAAIIAILPAVNGHPILLEELHVLHLVVGICFVQFGHHFSAHTMRKIKFSPFVVNILKHSLDSASLALAIIRLLRFLNLWRFLRDGNSFRRLLHPVHPSCPVRDGQN